MSLGFELFHIIARRDCTGSIQRLRCSTSEISKGNILGYYRNLGSLRYGNEYCVPGCFELHASVASFEEIGYAVPCHWFVFIAQHEPMDVQLQCVIEKSLQLKRKKGVFLRRSTRSHISGNRGMLLKVSPDLKGIKDSRSVLQHRSVTKPVCKKYDQSMNQPQDGTYPGVR